MIGYILDLEATVARACSARGIATGVSWTPLGSFMGRQRQEGLHKTWPSDGGRPNTKLAFVLETPAATRRAAAAAARYRASPALCHSAMPMVDGQGLI